MSSTKSNTNKRTRSGNSVSLKQGTLAFPTTKRTASSTPKAKKAATRTKSAPTPIEVEAIDSSGSSSPSASSSGFEERIEQSSADEYVGTRITGSSMSKQKVAPKAADKGKAPLRPRENTVAPGEINLRAENPGKWNKHYGQVREKMGNLEPSESLWCSLRSCKLLMASSSPR